MCLFGCIFLKLWKFISKSVTVLISSWNLLFCFMQTSHIVPLPIHPKPSTAVPVQQPGPHPPCSLLIQTAASQLQSPLMIIEQYLTVTLASALSTLGFIPSVLWNGLGWHLPGDTCSISGVSCAPLALGEHFSAGSQEGLWAPCTASHSSGLYFFYYFIAKVAVGAFAALC